MKKSLFDLIKDDPHEQKSKSAIQNQETEDVIIIHSIVQKSKIKDFEPDQDQEQEQIKKKILSHRKLANSIL